MSASRESHGLDSQIKAKFREHLGRYHEMRGARSYVSKGFSLLLTLPVAAVTIAGATLVATVFVPLALIALTVAPNKIRGKFGSMDQMPRWLALGLVLLSPIFVAILSVVVAGAMLWSLPKSFKSLSVGIDSVLKTRFGAIATASLLLATAVALLIAFPPAGAAAFIGAGSVLASSLGMAAFSSGAFAAAMGAITAGISFVSLYAVTKLKDSIKNSFVRKNKVVIVKSHYHHDNYEFNGDTTSMLNASLGAQPHNAADYAMRTGVTGVQPPSTVEVEPAPPAYHELARVVPPSDNDDIFSGSHVLPTPSNQYVRLWDAHQNPMDSQRNLDLMTMQAAAAFATQHGHDHSHHANHGDQMNPVHHAFGHHHGGA